MTDRGPIRIARCTVIAMLILGFSVFGFSVLGFTVAAEAQRFTNCDLDGGAAHCASATVGDRAVEGRTHEAGGSLGDAISQLMAATTDRTADSRSTQRPEELQGVKSFCAKHPGRDWHYYVVGGRMIASGTCPSSNEQAAAVADEFLLKHSDYVSNESNSVAMVNYMEGNRLNPLDEKSLERAYTDLKRYGRLALYKKS